jgi:AAHS family benzoate transporter-like MFS transporter
VTAIDSATSQSPGLRGRTLGIVIAICSLSITFDGYDLVVYGTTIPSLLKHWGISPAEAGAIGSYALIGMLIGALLIGTVADYIGRRRALIGCLVWFSVFMAVAAAAPSPGVFGLVRFLCGIGLGGLMPTVAALVIEYAPKGRGTFTYVLMQSGYALGGILAASLGIALIPAVGWQVMYLIGAAPLVLVVPLAWKFVPESLEYLVSRGRHDEARALAAKLDLPPTAFGAAPAADRSRGPQKLFVGGYSLGTILFWMATFCALLLVYGLNTWLPQIMRQAGYPLGSALSFLLVFNLGSIVGSLIGGRVADRTGTKPVIVVSFALAALGVAALSAEPATVLIYVLLALGGYGTIGTQNLLNSYVTSYYPGTVRATGIGWSLGVGRLGGILGPSIGGLILGSSLGLDWNFYFFGAIAVVGALVVAFVPRSPLLGARQRAAATAPGTAVASSGANVS